MSQFHIYGLGAALVDTEIQVSEADLRTFGIEKGVMTLVDQERRNELMALLSDHLVASKRACGGSGANTIIAASYFGAKCFYSCKVAEDDNGRFYLENLADAGVEFAAHIGQNEGITGKCLVMITPDADRTMNTFLGISETLSSQELDSSAVAASDYVYIEGYLASSETGREAAIALRQQAEQAGAKTALSLSDPFVVDIFREQIEAMVGDNINLLFCNSAEAMAFTKTETLAAAAEALKNHCDSYAITCGPEGALIFDGETSLQIPCPQVTAIDTNGAGDLFAGAFLHGLSQGWSFEKSGQLACISASTLVTQYGPRLRQEQYQQLLNQL